jgi:hypothetical protein
MHNGVSGLIQERSWWLARDEVGGWWPVGRNCQSWGGTTIHQLAEWGSMTSPDKMVGETPFYLL